MRKRYQTITTAHRFGYRVIMQRIMARTLKDPNLDKLVGFDVFVTSQYAGEDQSPLREVNYGPHGYRGAWFRYSPWHFAVDGNADQSVAAAEAAEVRFHRIVEMLADAEKMAHDHSRVSGACRG